VSAVGSRFDVVSCMRVCVHACVLLLRSCEGRCHHVDSCPFVMACTSFVCVATTITASCFLFTWRVSSQGARGSWRRPSSCQVSGIAARARCHAGGNVRHGHVCVCVWVGGCGAGCVWVWVWVCVCVCAYVCCVEVAMCLWFLTAAVTLLLLPLLLPLPSATTSLAPRTTFPLSTTPCRPSTTSSRLEKRCVCVIGLCQRGLWSVE